MRPDYAAVRRGDLTLAAEGAKHSRQDLRELTAEMLDAVEALIAGATDADIVFQPADPEANDEGAPPDERHQGWTLAHVLAHTTAGSEEAAAVALSLARGAPANDRPRYETPWPELTTVDQIRRRLDESRRMRLAMLDAWPDRPHLDETITPVEFFGPLNAPARFLLGLTHEDWHLPQIEEIMRQAKTAGGGSSA